MDIKSIVDRAVEDGKLTRAEHLKILEAVSVDGVVHDDEQVQLDRLNKLIENGVVEVVD